MNYLFAEQSWRCLEYYLLVKGDIPFRASEVMTERRRRKLAVCGLLRNTADPPPEPVSIFKGPVRDTSCGWSQEQQGTGLFALLAHNSRITHFDAQLAHRVVMHNSRITHFPSRRNTFRIQLALSPSKIGISAQTVHARYMTAKQSCFSCRFCNAPANTSIPSCRLQQAY